MSIQEHPPGVRGQATAAARAQVVLHGHEVDPQKKGVL